MKNISSPLAGVIALFLSTSAQAQSHDPAVLQAEGLKDTLAYEITEGLTTEIGARMAGTPDEARARIWALRKLNALGFANVREEPFMLPTWVRGVETAQTISPYPQKMHVTALGNSASTGDKGLEAEVVFFDSFASLRAAADGSLKGKIAFVSHDMHRTQDGSSYGAYGPARFSGPNIAAKKGAAGYVIKSIGTDHHRNPHAGVTNFDDGVAPIPAGALSLPDAANLERMIKLAQKNGQPVRMNLTLTPRNIGEQQSGNVIAEVKGRDPSKPMIVIACHLDSWDLATGALDDASGCAIITAAAKNIMNHGQPLRTIRLLWAGSEEVGLYGGDAYGEAHKGEKHALAMESDFGAGKIWRVEFKLPEAAKAVEQQIAEQLLPLGISHSGPPASGGADVQAIIANNNLAIIDLQQDGTYYFDIHHTPDDTLDKVDPAAMAQNVAAWSTVLAIIANSDVDFTMPTK